MKNLMAAINQMTRAVELWATQAMMPEKPTPMRCVCKRLFRGGMKTWLPHWKKDHPKLCAAYQKKTGHDRANLMLGMMRKAKPLSKD